MSHILETQIAEIKEFILQQTVLKKEMLNVKELALYAGISTSYIYKLTCSRSIPYHKPATKLLYFKKSEVDEWLLQNRHPSKSELSEIPLPKRSK